MEDNKFKFTRDNLNELVDIAIKYLTPSALSGALVAIGLNNPVIGVLVSGIVNTILLAVKLYLKP